MPIDFQRVWNWYSRESVQNALLEVAKNREVVSVFKDGKYGKRPDVLQYPQDIIQAVAEGTIAFHGSVERWSQPMKLDVGLTREQLDKLRIGWDIIIDVDVDDFDIAKITTSRIIEALKDHGVSSYSCKFTGGSSFHIGIPFESLPPKVNLRDTSQFYPELFQTILEYIKWYIEASLGEEILKLGEVEEISQRVNKPLSEILDKDGKISPFKFISIDAFGSRHLFRLPYSLHESSLLVSLPIKPEKIFDFKREDAIPERVRVDEKFLAPKTNFSDAEALVIEALDWSAKYKKEMKVEVEEIKRVKKKIKVTNEDFFPPCIKTILKGLSDGRKRSIFVLVNFLRNMGWELPEIEKRMFEWNEKNSPPLRMNYLRTQLRWHFRQDRNLLPPNCDNKLFYSDMNVCNPDEICMKGIKNPINYPFKKRGKRKK